MAKRQTSQKRIELCRQLFQGKYDYSQTDFSNVKKKTSVICPIHGPFLIDFDHHYHQKQGCKWCSYPVRDTESFIKESSTRHHNFYDYSKAKYVDSHSPITIICPIHGEFKQSPNAHLQGEGCPKCSLKQNKLEETVEQFLKQENIEYITQYKPVWLKRDKRISMSLDFYLPKYSLAIECQGKQHFGKGGWSKLFDFNVQMERDMWKKEQCEKNGVELVYFAHKYTIPKEYIGKIFTSTDELMTFIQYLFIN